MVTRSVQTNKQTNEQTNSALGHTKNADSVC